MKSINVAGVIFNFQFFDESLLPVFEKLKEDFLLFDPESPYCNTIQVQVRNIKEFNSQALTLKSKSPIFQTAFSSAYSWYRRTISFDDSHFIVYRHKHVEVYGKDHESLHEFLYTFMISTAGEQIDLTGWHRLHAVSFLYKNRSYCILLPSGGGKSSLAEKLLSDPRFSLIGDEIVLTNGSKIRPFPLKISLQKKPALNEAQFFIRKRFPSKWFAKYPSPKDSAIEDFQLLVGNKSRGLSLNKAELSDYIKLFLYAVIGWGVPQMREFMIRGGAELSLVTNFFLRVKMFISLAQKPLQRINYDFENFSPDQLSKILEPDLTPPSTDSSLNKNDNPGDIRLLP